MKTAKNMDNAKILREMAKELSVPVDKLPKTLRRFQKEIDESN